LSASKRTGDLAQEAVGIKGGVCTDQIRGGNQATLARVFKQLVGQGSNKRDRVQGGCKAMNVVSLAGKGRQAADWKRTGLLSCKIKISIAHILSVSNPNTDLRVNCPK
jgi:hypothetical protein